MGDYFDRFMQSMEAKAVRLDFEGQGPKGHIAVTGNYDCSGFLDSCLSRVGLGGPTGEDLLPTLADHLRYDLF